MSFQLEPSNEPVSLAIPADDGFALSASLFEPLPDRKLPAVIIINSAMTVPRRFYRLFAEWLVAMTIGNRLT